MCLPPRHKASGPLSCLVLPLPQSILLQQAFLKCPFLSLQERPMPQGVSPPLTSGPALLSLKYYVLPFDASYCVAYITALFLLFSLSFLSSFLSSCVISTLSSGTVLFLWHARPERPHERDPVSPQHAAGQPNRFKPLVFFSLI